MQHYTLRIPRQADSQPTPRLQQSHRNPRLRPARNSLRGAVNRRLHVTSPRTLRNLGPIILSAFLLAGVLWVSGAVWAQEAAKNPGTLIRIAGKVVDRTGAVLPRVTIRIDDEGGKRVAATQSNGRGEFSLELREGKYLLTAALAGFVPLRDHPLEAAVPPAPLTLTLEVPGVEQQIVVTATNTAAPLSQVGSSVTVLTGDSLSRDGISSVAEALRRVAGVNLVQSGGAGSVTSLFMRGGESKYTKVMIDGIVLNEPGGSYNFANLSTTDVDRIEIVRGPQSALFGSDAVAGVIQIFTRRGSSEGLSPQPRFLFEGGTFASYRYAGGFSGKTDRMDYAASFSRSDTDNDVLNGSFNEETITGNLGFFPSHGTEVRAVFRSEAGRAGVPGPWAFLPPDPDEYYRHRDLAGGLTFTHQATMSWSQKISYTVTDSRQFSEDPFDSGSYVASYQGRTAPFPSYDLVYQTLNQTRRQKLSYQSDLTLSHGHLVTAGVDYERERGTIGDPNALPLEARRDNYGGYLQDQWSFRNRFFATGGVRLDHNSSFGFFASPRVSLALHVHQPAPGSFLGLTKIKANFGLGIKEPTLLESYSQSPYFRGNPNLKPEKSTSFDAGIEQHFGAGRTILDLTYFDSRFRDQIGFATTNYQTFEGTFFNIGKTRARGVETIVRQDLGYGFDLGGAYTFLDSKVLESTNAFDPAFAQGQELFRRPRHSGYLDLRWKPRRWTLGATGIFVGSRVDSDFVGLGMTRNPGYGILDLLANYRLSEGISVFALVNNALDKSYMEVLGYPALRANFRVGLSAGF